MPLKSSTGDVNKLPKWAQERIATLERQVASLDGLLRESAESDPLVYTEQWPNGGVGKSVKLPIKLGIGGVCFKSREHVICVRPDIAGRLCIMLTYGRAVPLLVEPSSSNVVFVSPRGDY